MEGQQLEQDMGQHYTLQCHFYKMFIEKWATVFVHESMLLVRIVEYIQADQDTATTSSLILCSIIVLNQICISIPNTK